MTLPTGLVPTLVFVLTVGISVPVTLAAHVAYRDGTRSFGSALRAALLEAGLLYLVGVAVVWSVAGGGPLWGVPAALVAVGVGALLGFVALPLIVGRKLVRRLGNADSETALRYATYGWPATALAVFGLFVAPGGLTRGHLFQLEGARICLVGFCGIAASIAAAVFVESLLAVFGPGLVGSLLASRR